MDLREQIRSCDDSKVSEPIPCPEWGGDTVLYVRIISGSERDAFDAASFVQKGKKREMSLQDIRARLVCLAACDATGSPVFRRGDEKWLTRKSTVPLDRLYAAAAKLNGLTTEDIEELAGNSVSVQSDDSGSN